MKKEAIDHLRGAIETYIGYLFDDGAYNDVTFRQRDPTQDYLKMAVEAVLQGELPDPSQTNSYGCSIVRALP